MSTFLISAPYTLLPVGILGLSFAFVATKRRRRLLGFASGFLLFELMYIVFVGGLVTIARSDVSGRIVWPVTLLILMHIVFTSLCNSFRGCYVVVSLLVFTPYVTN